MSDDDEDRACMCDHCGCQIAMDQLQPYYDMLLCGECLEKEVNPTEEKDGQR